MATVSEPAEIVKVSPATTAFDAVRALDAMKFPAVEASQMERCEYVSEVLTFVHVRSADVVIDPAEAAENVAC